MNIPLPIYTFLVNNIDYTEIYSNNIANEINDIIYSLNNQSIYMPYFKKGFKNGDIFTLYGKRAKIIYDNFINKKPKILEFICSTDDLPTIIKKEGHIDIQTLPQFISLNNNYSKTIINGHSSMKTINLLCFDENNLPVNSELFLNNLLLDASPNNSFNISINSKEVLNVKLKSNNNFYFKFSGIEAK